MLDLDDMAEATADVGYEIAFWSRSRRWFVFGVALIVIGFGVHLYLS
jgi:hypothetical protein